MCDTVAIVHICVILKHTKDTILQVIIHCQDNDAALDITSDTVLYITSATVLYTANDLGSESNT